MEKEENQSTNSDIKEEIKENKDPDKSSTNKDSANNFLSFMISNDFQSVIPTTNIMYPVINIKNQLPKAYEKIIIPDKFLQIDPLILSNNKEIWIKEWLNAS